jgi:hypothetical protein
MTVWTENMLEERLEYLRAGAESIGLNIDDRLNEIDIINRKRKSMRNFIKKRRCILSLNIHVGRFLVIREDMSKTYKGLTLDHTFSEIIEKANAGLI